MYYAYRFGFGSEGHGKSIYVAEGQTCQEAKENAKAVLQKEFGGLWVGKFRETFIGRKPWLRSQGFSLSATAERS